MSDNWQPGDLALCIKSGDLTIAGKIYTVRKVYIPGVVYYEGGEFWSDDVLCLDFHEFPFVPGYCSEASRFIKVTPREADEEDAETIRLLTGKPVREPVA